jgi:hypothetical protein
MEASSSGMPASLSLKQSFQGKPNTETARQTRRWPATAALAAVAGYDGAGPSAAGKSGPSHAVAEDVTEALGTGRFFGLLDAKGRELAIGRLYDPSGQNELAPLDDFGRQNLVAARAQLIAAPAGDQVREQRAPVPRATASAARPIGCGLYLGRDGTGARRAPG